MKTLKRSAAILLAVLCVLSLTACSVLNSITGIFGGDSSIVGTWKYPLSMKSVMEQMAESAEDEEAAMYDVMAGAMDGVNFDLYFEFDAEGNYNYYTDEESGKQAVEKMKENLIAVLPDLFEAMGVEKSDYESYLTSMGTTEEELAASLAESLDSSDFTDLSGSGTYKTEDGKLFMDDDSDNYITIELKDGKLIFTGFVGDADSIEDFPEWLFPMTFSKVK